MDWKENTHYSIGLFLVQYLGNGFNLADAAHLTYNDHYFQSGKKSFHFVRQKTEDRSDMEVVIPIIPPLQQTLLMPEFLITTYPRVWVTQWIAISLTATLMLFLLPSRWSSTLDS